MLAFGALTFAAYAGVTLTPSVRFSYTFDSNLPQNITEYADHYGTPELKLTLYRSHPRTSLMLWTTVTYEHYLRKRSAILNEPFWDIAGLIKREAGSTEWKIVGAFYEYLDPDWGLTKIKYRVDPSFELRLGRGEITLAAPLEWHDYGREPDAATSVDTDELPDEDAFEVQGEASYVYDFKVLKRQRFAVRDIGLDIDYVYRAAFGDDDYQGVEIGLDAEIKAGRFAFKPDVSGEYRVYGGADVDTRTEKLVRRVNRYLDMGMDIEFEPIDWLTLSTGGVYKIKQSTYSLYTYDRYVLFGEIEISPRFALQP
jgi:hypothetical protein